MEKAEALQLYKKFVADNPSDKEGARRSFYDKFGVDPDATGMFGKKKGEGLTSEERTLAKRRADSLHAGATEGYKQDIATAKSKFVGDVSKAIPVAATLATGGLAAPVAAAALGGAGAASGIWEEGAKLAFGAKDAPTSAKELAKSVGVDAVLGAATELGGRAAGKLIEWGGKKVLLPMVAKAAAQTDKGMEVLRTHGSALMNQLREMSVGAGDAGRTNIGRELETLDAKLALRQSGIGKATREVMKDIAEKVHKWDGSLSGLAEIKGDISQAAWKREGIHYEERKALTDFVAAIDRKLSDGFKQIGGEQGKALYEAQKETVGQLHRYSVGLDLAKESMRRLSYKLGYGALGAGYGGYEGYRHGGLGGGIAGALAGGAVAAGGRALEERAAPWLLQKLLTEKGTAPIVRQALSTAQQGNIKAAAKIFARAVAQSGVKDLIAPIAKDLMSDTPEPEAAP